MRQMAEWLGMAALVLAGVALVLALFMVVVWLLRSIVRETRKMSELSAPHFLGDQLLRSSLESGRSWDQGITRSIGSARLLFVEDVHFLVSTDVGLLTA
jgi:Flp pilus assembly protein TadB